MSWRLMIYDRNASFQRHQSCHPFVSFINHVSLPFNIRRFAFPSQICAFNFEKRLHKNLRLCPLTLCMLNVKWKAIIYATNILMQPWYQFIWKFHFLRIRKELFPCESSTKLFAGWFRWARGTKFY
jgi:hypothetical protein